MYHPDIVLTYAHDRQHNLIAEAQRHRLVSPFRRRSRTNALARRRPAAGNAAISGSC